MITGVLVDNWKHPIFRHCLAGGGWEFCEHRGYDSTTKGFRVRHAPADLERLKKFLVMVNRDAEKWRARAWN